jgi:hypothetical protein
VIMNRYGLTLGTALTLGLGLVWGGISTTAQATPLPQQLAQVETEEVVESCVALQEVTTGATEINKRIENRFLTRDNWNTDFAVPNDQDFNYYVAILAPENDGPYELTVNLKFPDDTFATAYSNRRDLTSGDVYSVPFISPTGEQPFEINARVGGVNGNRYTLAIVACSEVAVVEAPVEETPVATDEVTSDTTAPVDSGVETVDEPAPSTPAEPVRGLW